jgi:glutathione S-transferase
MDGREYVVDDKVSVADFVLAYTLDWANMVGLLEEFPRLRGYMERLYQRPHAPMRIAEAFASIRA